MSRSGWVQLADGYGRIDPAQIRAIIGRTRAGTVVAGAYESRRDSVWFRVQVIDVLTGAVLRDLSPVGAPRSAPLGAIEALRLSVAAAVDTLLTLDRGR